MMAIPTNAKERKNVPIATGVIDYFPDAIAAVAALSRIGNDQHNPGKPLHWDRSKSGDESDALMRHFMERGTVDTDGVRHSTKVAWRALANLQKELENERASNEVVEQRPVDTVCSDVQPDRSGNVASRERAQTARALGDAASRGQCCGGRVAEVVGSRSK